MKFLYLCQLQKDKLSKCYQESIKQKVGKMFGTLLSSENNETCNTYQNLGRLCLPFIENLKLYLRCVLNIDVVP